MKSNVCRLSRRIVAEIFSAPNGRNLMTEVVRLARMLPLRIRTLFIKELAKEVGRRRLRNRAVLEFAGKIPEELVGRLNDEFSVTFEKLENKQLIAGLCLTVGDQRWEQSVRASLAQFLQ